LSQRIDFLHPVMAIVTYILLTALHSGIHERFHPQVCGLCFPTRNDTKVLILPLQILGESASRATAVIFLDLCFVKLGCYILNIQGSSQVIDIIAYGGYKFVGYTYILSTMG
jgi:protein transport protein YIF1